MAEKSRVHSMGQGLERTCLCCLLCVQGSLLRAQMHRRKDSGGS